MPRKNASSTKNLTINTKNRGLRDDIDDDDDEYEENQGSNSKSKTSSTTTKQNKNKNQVKSGASSRTSSRSSASSSSSSSTSSSNENQQQKQEDEDDDEKQFDPDALKVLHRFGSAPSVNNLTALTEQEKAAGLTKKSARAFPKAPNNNADTRPASNVSTAYSATPASISLRATSQSNNNNNNALNSTPSSDMLTSQQGTNNINTASTMSMPNAGNNYNNHISGEFPSSTEIYESSDDVSGKNSNVNTKKNNENNNNINNNTNNEIVDDEEEEEEEDDEETDELQQQEEDEDPFHQLRGHHPTCILFVPRAPRNEKQLGRFTKAPYKGASRLKGPKWTYLWHCLPCRYGDECVFKKKQMFCKRAHTQEELRCPQYSLYGICKDGANCKLNHSLGTMDEARRLFDVQRQKQVDDETKKLIEMKRQQLELSNGDGEGNNIVGDNNNNENAGPTLIPLPTQTTLDALPTLTMTVREQKDRLWKTQMCVRGDQCRAFRLNFWCHDCHEPKELRCKSFALFGVCLDAERGCPLVHSNRTEKQEMQRIRSQIENSRFMTGDYGDEDENGGEDRHHLQVPGVKPPSKNSNNKNKNNVSAMKIPSSNPNTAHDDNSSSSSSCRSSSSSSSRSSSCSSNVDDDNENETENKSAASPSTNPVSKDNNKNQNETAKDKDHTSPGKGNRHGHSHRHHHGGGGGGGAGGVKKWNFKVGNAGGIPDGFKRASQVGEDDELDDMVRRGRGMNRSPTSTRSSGASNSNVNNKNQVGRGGNDIGEEDEADADEVMKSSLIVDGKVALKTAVQIPIKFVENGGKKGRGSRQASAKTSPSLPPQQDQHVDPNNFNAAIGNPKKPQKKPFVLADHQQQQQAQQQSQSSSSKFLLRAERNLYKTEFCPSLHFCREYRNYNWCDDAHTLDELRCPQFALTGKCPREDRCPLRHNHETRAEAKLQCEDYRKKTLGLKATKLRPDQMRTLPNPEVLTPALAAKLSAMAECQRRLLLSNTTFCPLGVDCRPHSQGLPCGQCHEANDLLCPFQMLYGECICSSVDSTRVGNVDSGFCTTKCTRQHVDTDFPDAPLPSTKQESQGAGDNQPLHHRHRVLVVGGNNTSETATPLITTTKPAEASESNENDTSTPASTSLASPSSLLAVPSNSPSRGGKNKKNAPPKLARSNSHFFDSETGEALFYVDVPPSLTITGASPLVQDNEDQNDCFSKKSQHRHHHHHHHHHDKANEQEINTNNEEASSPKSPPQFKTTPLASSATATGNTFTTTNATNTANQNNHQHHHGRSCSNSSAGSTPSSPTTSNNNNHLENNNNNGNGSHAVNILPLNATSNSAGPSMPNHWVDYLWKTRWCPFLANCKEYLTGSSWCFGAHEESELRCPQYALTQVMQEKFAKEIESGEIKIDEKYGACPRGSECPFCHTSGTAKEQKAKFARGEVTEKDDTAQKITATTSSKSLSNMSGVSDDNTNNNNSKDKSPIQQPSVVSPVMIPDIKPESASPPSPSTFVEPAIPEALLSQYRILKSAERRRLFFKTSLCPLLAPLCEDCVHNRCFFASTLRELRCPYFSLFGLCPRRRCEWLHCTHEALGTCRSPALNAKPSTIGASNANAATFSSKSPSSTPSTSALSSPQQHHHPMFRVDPPEFLWPPTPQLTPQIAATPTSSTGNKKNNDDDDESMPDLTLQ